jgi:hypothetical protein
MSFKVLRGFFYFLACFLLLPSLCYSDSSAGFTPYPGIIHIHSNISSAEAYSLRRSVELAREKGIKIIIFTDSLLRRWEYGLPVFSNIFKVSMEEGSVFKYGIKRYLRDLENLRKEFPDMLILEGAEVTPHYWWQGNFFKKKLIMNDWNKQFLAIGLNKYSDYRYLPVSANRYFFPRLKDFPILLISLFFIFPGLAFLKRKSRVLGISLIIAGILLLLNFFPFSASRYSPYSSQKKYSAHQVLINYVNKHGGVTFWSLPQVTDSVSLGKFAGVNFYTPSYTEALMLTSDYAGFGVSLLSGNNNSLILAGGKWDKVLIGYCEGKRAQPVWLIGESDYRGNGDIGAMQNVFLLKEFNYASIYDSLRKGRLYVRSFLKNKTEVSLSDFYVEVSRIHIKGNYKIKAEQSLRIELIRNGEVIKEFNPGEGGVFDLEFQDAKLRASAEKCYYRLNIYADNSIILASNPIFFNF